MFICLKFMVYIENEYFISGADIGSGIGAPGNPTGSLC